jgi:RNA recognition motif-containing protein
MSTSRIFVGNLSFRTTEAQLKRYFEDIGPIVAVHIPVDATSQRSRGFGFVEFGTEEEARMAIEVYDGRRLGGRNIHVKPSNDAQPRRAKPDGIQSRRQRTKHWEDDLFEQDRESEHRDHKPRRDWREMRRSKRSFQ